MLLNFHGLRPVSLIGKSHLNCSVESTSYIDLERMTAAAAETQDRAAMTPIGILASLGISTAMYMLVSFVMVHTHS